MRRLVIVLRLSLPPWLFLSLLLLGVGCRMVPMEPRAATPLAAFPANAFITERAVFTAYGRQFPLNGYLALSETGGKRLVITESFGQVVADVLVKADGTVFVMQTSRLFPEKSVRYGIASDLQCIFGGFPPQPVEVQMTATNHFIVQHGFYRLDLRLLNIQPGPQPAALFDPTKAPPP
jgi:hypothetical protein